MRLINVKAFLKREELIRKRMRVDPRTKVLEFCDNETTAYAILSHRWIDQEVNYDEMIGLAKMDREERDEIRQREGYQKIFDCCQKAKGDRYEWLWVDTCCIDKGSSAELSEAINSMYLWYENAKVCYAYLHDVPGTIFPITDNDEKYPNSNGWPEWFSRGWTLQEMIAPSDVQFFNRDWQPIGDKRTLAPTLSRITRVPRHILTDGFSSNRPCVAQILSWAAGRTTTRVEDRAYSLLGLLDVNMPMLYGEGKKAFHRLQLEIIRVSNDQSIFAWGAGLFGDHGRAGSILADDPGFFWNCHEMKLMDPSEFIQRLKDAISEEELALIEDRFGTFPITNRGIQIWMLLRPLDGSDSVFQAWLPCRAYPLDPPVIITLALWKSNYYRYPTSRKRYPTKPSLQFRQVYLRYQNTPHREITFEVDDSMITKSGFIYHGTFPSKHTGNTFTLTSSDPLCVRVYSDDQARCRFAMGFGQYLGQDWIHFVYEKFTNEYSWKTYSRSEYDKMLVRGPEHAGSMVEARSQGGRYGRVWVKHICLPGSTWTVRTSCVVWEPSRSCGVKIDPFPYPYNGPDQWAHLDVLGTNDPNCDMRGLMIPDSRSRYTLLVDGVPMEFLLAPKGIKLGDYGYFTAFEDFRCEGNIFADFRSLSSDPDITPRQHKIDKKGHKTDSDYVEATHSDSFSALITLYKPLGLSLPSNHDVNSLLASLSIQLTNKYLVIRVIQCTPSGESIHWARSYRSSTFDPITPLCIIAKPFVWYRNEVADSASVDQSDRQ